MTPSFSPAFGLLLIRAMLSLNSIRAMCLLLDGGGCLVKERGERRLVSALDCEGMVANQICYIPR